MPQRRLIRTAIVTVAAILVILASATATLAADADTTPPTAPFIGYASGLQWLGPCQVTVGLERSTDDVTPQSALTYEVFADGVYLGTLIDRGTDSSVWGVLNLQHGGVQHDHGQGGRRRRQPVRTQQRAGHHRLRMLTSGRYLGRCQGGPSPSSGSGRRA